MSERLIDQVTAVVITYNEAPNIARCLDKLAWAKRIVVVDSGSTDETLEIVRRYQQTEVIHRKFDDFASQCNFGISQVLTPWVLSLDADYELSNELAGELPRLDVCDEVAGFRARFIYRIFGRPLRGTLYPPRAVLYRKDLASYRNEGHGHRVSINGPLANLRGVIYHDDRKPLGRWVSSQQSYARKEVDHLFAASKRELSRADRIRRIGWAAPILVFFHALLVKGCILDGWPGWLYVLQRTFAEILIAIEIVDRKLRSVS
jgi:glycosyltransferase involved in cell wall biosynthesis